MIKKEEGLTPQKTPFQEALKLVKVPIIMALMLTPIRFTLELIGLPESFIFIIGLLWLTIGVSIYWAIKYSTKKRFLIVLLLGLIIYSPISRCPVALAWWIDTNWQLGTHYGLFFDNFGQVLFNQVVYGSLIQIIPGFVVGAITSTIMRHKLTLKLKNNTVDNG